MLPLFNTVNPGRPRSDLVVNRYGLAHNEVSPYTLSMVTLDANSYPAASIPNGAFQGPPSSSSQNTHGHIQALFAETREKYWGVRETDNAAPDPPPRNNTIEACSYNSCGNHPKVQSTPKISTQETFPKERTIFDALGSFANPGGARLVNNPELQIGGCPTDAGLNFGQAPANPFRLERNDEIFGSECSEVSSLSEVANLSLPNITNEAWDPPLAGWEFEGNTKEKTPSVLLGPIKEDISEHVPDSILGAPVPVVETAGCKSLGDQTKSPRSKKAGRKKHKCPVCRKIFKRPSSFKIHFSIHTGDKQYMCRHENCGKCFNVKSNLTRHEKLHRR